jgi:PKHD-type hydroxylase
MLLDEYIWIFKSVLTPRFCDDIIEYGNSLKDHYGVVGGKQINGTEKQKLNHLKKTRDSKIVWLEGKWIYKETEPYIDIANKNAGWNFKWDWTEPNQFTKYKVGQYYHWHQDQFTLKESEKRKIEGNKIRKISMSCQLSNPSEYMGGDLEFCLNAKPPGEKSNKIYKIEKTLPKGSIIVFPSFVWHRVTKVTHGTRYSLVSWSNGDPYQ